VIRKKTIYEEEPIPDDREICPDCKGLGQFRWRWSEPFGGNVPAETEYRTCIRCGGLGYVRKDEGRMELAVSKLGEDEND